MRIDFYLLTADTIDAHGLFTCRLLEKAYHQGHRIFVYCNNETEAGAIDELLWTFKPDSFIPHHLQGEGPEPPPPIQIGYGPEPRGFRDILLNLADTIPVFYTRFQRVIEIVAASEPAKIRGRERFRVYRNTGLVPNTHSIT